MPISAVAGTARDVLHTAMHLHYLYQIRYVLFARNFLYANIHLIAFYIQMTYIQWT
jgi:hypothetical protein